MESVEFYGVSVPRGFRALLSWQLIRNESNEMKNYLKNVSSMKFVSSFLLAIIKPVMQDGT